MTNMYRPYGCPLDVKGGHRDVCSPLDLKGLSA